MLDANSVSQILYTDTQLGLAANQTLNISKINLFSYSSDGRRNTDFDVLYTLDGSTWQYAFIGAANSITTGSGNFKLSSLARDDSADFLTGVRGLRFDLRPVNYTLQSGVIEIDVFGVAVPEPSSLAMMLFGTIALWVVGRKRQ